jgi:serine/threonine protein kinase
MPGDERNLDQTFIALTSGGKTGRVLKIGDIIGDSYRLKGLIGRGGMGYVFRAEHIIIGKDYALKMLAPDQINEITWNRFQSEGKAIAHLDHRNIVKVYNMGIDQGDYPYYVMDLLDGVALDDCILDKMPFTIDEILDMFIQLASGLGYAHSHGIIHRDVKPSNVVLVDSGDQYPTAKIVDFGIAKLAGSGDLHQQSLTATGEIFGSPYYMSPEQCLGTEIDHRADIYSLGCTLFEVLCGRPPFIGESALQTVMMHQNKPSPTIESVSGKFSSDEIEELVAKMLMKRPADRYQSMEQVVHDLDRILQRKAVGKNVETGFKSSVDSQLEDLGSRYEEEQKSKRRRKNVLIAVGTVVVVFVSSVCVNALYWAAQRPKASHETLDLSVPTPKERNEGIKRPDKGIAEVDKKIDAVKIITSTINKADGMKVFHCPQLHIGAFTWSKEIFDFYGIKLPSDSEYHVEAFGEARVPADKPIFLQVDAAKNRETWLHPDILAKFGPGELTGLKLAQSSPIDAIGTDESTALEGQRVTALVKAITGWTNCQQFEFYDCLATDQALIELDKLKTLKRFGARSASINGKIILKGLKGSSSIEFILLEKGSISASGLKALAGCHNLKVLLLEHCKIDSDAIEVIASIKSLRVLKIIKGDLKPQQIPVMAKLVFIEKISLDLTGWHGGTHGELYKVLPQANLEWRKQLGKPRFSPAPIE